MTAHRDLELLEQRGVLNRIHGGAVQSGFCSTRLARSTAATRDARTVPHSAPAPGNKSAFFQLVNRPRSQRPKRLRSLSSSPCSVRMALWGQSS